MVRPILQCIQFVAYCFSKVGEFLNAITSRVAAFAKSFFATKNSVVATKEAKDMAATKENKNCVATKETEKIEVTKIKKETTKVEKVVLRMDVFAADVVKKVDARTVLSEEVEQTFGPKSSKQRSEVAQLTDFEKFFKKWNLLDDEPKQKIKSFLVQFLTDYFKNTAHRCQHDFLKIHQLLTAKDSQFSDQEVTELFAKRVVLYSPSWNKEWDKNDQYDQFKDQWTSIYLKKFRQPSEEEFDQETTEAIGRVIAAGKALPFERRVQAAKLLLNSANTAHLSDAVIKEIFELNFHHYHPSPFDDSEMEKIVPLYLKQKPQIHYRRTLFLVLNHSSNVDEPEIKHLVSILKDSFHEKIKGDSFGRVSAKDFSVCINFLMKQRQHLSDDDKLAAARQMAECLGNIEPTYSAQESEFSEETLDSISFFARTILDDPSNFEKKPGDIWAHLAAYKFCLRPSKPDRKAFPLDLKVKAAQQVIESSQIFSDARSGRKECKKLVERAIAVALENPASFTGDCVITADYRKLPQAERTVPFAERILSVIEALLTDSSSRSRDDSKKNHTLLLTSFDYLQSKKPDVLAGMIKDCFFDHLDKPLLEKCAAFIFTHRDLFEDNFLTMANAHVFRKKEAAGIEANEFEKKPQWQERGTARTLGKEFCDKYLVEIYGGTTTKDFVEKIKAAYIKYHDDSDWSNRDKNFEELLQICKEAGVKLGTLIPLYQYSNHAVSIRYALGEAFAEKYNLDAGSAIGMLTIRKINRILEECTSERAEQKIRKLLKEKGLIADRSYAHEYVKEVKKQAVVCRY